MQLLLAAGVDAVILPQPVVADPSRLLTALHQHRVTHFTAVPTLLQAMACQAALSAGLAPHQQPAPSDHVLSDSESPSGILQKATPDAVPPVTQPSAWGLASELEAAAGQQPRPELASTTQLGIAAVSGSLTAQPLSLSGAQPLSSEAGPAAQAGAAVLPLMRLLASSGEPLAAGLLQAVQALLPAGCQVVNLYGSTEVAADCTCWAASAAARPPEASAALTGSRLQSAAPSTALTGRNGADERAHAAVDGADERAHAAVDGADERAHAAAAGAATPLQRAAAAQLTRQSPATVPRGVQQSLMDAAAAVAGTACKPGGAVVPCGFPIRGMAVWVSPVADGSGGPVGGAGDQQLTPVPSVLRCGQEGEVWVAGIGLARGYHR